jgi:hypothetical protein
MADQILLAARELRRHWQHRHGALIHPLLFHPDNAIVVNRAQAADLSVAMIRLAWELQLSGNGEAWERLENSSMADLTRSFAREAYLDFRTLNSGQAAAAVFESWFLSERCRLEDKKLIKQMLSDYKGYVFDKEEGQKSITPSLISALGEMPHGKNYLSPHAGTILQDPVFLEVRDRSNANFLWFIKFERSFRETEEALQSKPEHYITMDPSSGKPSKTPQFSNNRPSSSKYEKEQTSAEIVRLFRDEKPVDKPGKSGKLLRGNAGGKRKNGKATKQARTNVVYLRRWSGE